MKQQDVMERTRQAHAERFGAPPQSMAWAPGRIEVLGNHTDYNEGTTLSAAINYGLCFCISASSNPGIRLLAVDMGETAFFDTTDDGKVPGYGWADYVKGVFRLIGQETGRAVDGLDCTLSGSIPMGSGLSSSAALEVSSAWALLHHLDQQMDPAKVGALCREAEHRYAGANCGLLDQFSSIFGRDHGLIHTDFRTLEVTGVSLPDEIEFLVVNPRVKHSLVNSPYNERRERCEQAAAQLSGLLNRPVRALRDVTPDEFAACRDRLDPVAARRAAHIIGEIDRVERGVELIHRGDMEAFGELLFASHQSSIENFENSCAELDGIVEAARAEGAPGARLSGGGFGGSAVVMVRTSLADSLARAIADRCREMGFDPDILTIVPSAGAIACPRGHV